MRFTALHRAVGAAPSEVTDDLLQQAIDAAAVETTDLDWKKELPSAAVLAKSDFAKDVAAMANVGGGMIVYGVTEYEKAATGRHDTGMLSEAHERTMKQVAVAGIAPPVMGLRIDVLVAGDGCHAVAVEVPASVDGPHLIYRGEFFGAPVRNGSDTVWMRERDIEAAYRTRLSARRAAAEELVALYDELLAAHGVNDTARLVGVARPLLPTTQPRADRTQAAAMFGQASTLADSFTPNTRAMLSEFSLDLNNPRIGLRRWAVYPSPGRDGDDDRASAAIHHDGSVTYSARAGGDLRSSTDHAPGHWVRSVRVEMFAASLLALVAAAARHYSTSIYEVRAGIEWSGPGLQLETIDGSGYPFMPPSPPLVRYAPVGAEIRGDLPDAELAASLREFAADMINQGGVTHFQVIPRA